MAIFSLTALCETGEVIAIVCLAILLPKMYLAKMRKPFLTPSSRDPSTSTSATKIAGYLRISIFSKLFTTS